MPVVAPGAFGRLLRSLDDERLAAFVADLWAERGRETTVEGATVVATGGPFGGRQRIRCVTGTWRRHPEVPPMADGVDVVVAARETRHLRTAVAGRDVRLLGPEDVRRMVLYAVDREAAERLFAAHFGRPLALDEPATRLRGRLPAGTTPARLGVGLLVVLAVGLALGAVGGDGSLALDARPVEVAPAPVTSPPPAAGHHPTADGGRSPGPESGARSALRYPPGIGPSGVTDASSLAAAHRAAVAATSWDLLLVHRGSKDLLDPERRWVASRQTVDRRSASRYWYRVTGLERAGDGEFSTTIYDDYADGTDNYRRIAGTPAPEYRRTRLPRAGGDGVFAAAGASYVRRYLATSESRVEVVETGNGTRYRVVATGTPSEILAPVSNYTAVAVVGRRGAVYRLTVEFVRLDRRHDPYPSATPASVAAPVPAGPAGAVRFRLVYRDYGRATVGVPAWYGAARNAANGTAAGPWPNDPGA